MSRKKQRTGRTAYIYIYANRTTNSDYLYAIICCFSVVPGDYELTETAFDGQYEEQTLAAQAADADHAMSYGFRSGCPTTLISNMEWLPRNLLMHYIVQKNTKMRSRFSQAFIFYFLMMHFILFVYPPCLVRFFFTVSYISRSAHVGKYDDM